MDLILVGELLWLVCPDIMWIYQAVFFQRTVATIIESSSDVLVIGQGGDFLRGSLYFSISAPTWNRHNNDTNYNPFFFNKVVGSPSSLRKLGSILIAFVVHFHPNLGKIPIFIHIFSFMDASPLSYVFHNNPVVGFPVPFSQHQCHNIHAFSSFSRCNIFPSAVVVLSRWHPCILASCWSRNAPWRSVRLMGWRLTVGSLGVFCAGP